MASAGLGDKVREIFILLNWLDWVGLAIALLLLGLLVFLIWRRRHAQDGGKPALTVPKKLLLPPDCLVRVWRDFVSAIPWRLHADALGVPLSLVIGDAGAGKSTLIDRHANWQGEQYSFRPSAVNDALLQVYSGAAALVLEFGAGLLYDTDASAFRAIGRLWRRLPPEPQAVLVMDATTLLSPRTEILRQSGQAMFGKLKIFGKLEGKPLPLVLALSHMDKVVGFMEFCRFTDLAGIPLQIEFPERDGIEQLETCLQGFQALLPRALVTCTAQDYLKIVAFLTEAPRLLAVLRDVLRVAGLEQGLASPPVFRLCLLSDQVNSFGCHPFAPPPAIDKPALFALNGHAKAALGILCLGLVHFIGGYFYQQDRVADARKKILGITEITADQYAENISPLFLDYSWNLNKDAWLSFLPEYFIRIDNDNNAFLINKIREYSLLPLLKRIQNDRDANFKTVKLIGFMYATNNNGMGRILQKHADKNPVEDASYDKLFDDYLLYNNDEKPYELDRLLNQGDINFSESRSIIEDPAQWLRLFRNFQQLLKKPFLREAEFISLQQDLKPFNDILDRMDYYAYQTEINTWLKYNTHLRPDSFEFGNGLQGELSKQHRQIDQLVRMVNGFNPNTTDNCENSLPLSQCMDKALAVANTVTNNSSSKLEFRLEGEHFDIDREAWNKLVKRSRVSLMLQDRMGNHGNDGWIFFGSYAIGNDLEVNGGQTPVSGKARIDGRLTVEAFDNYVKPAVLKLADFAAGLDKLMPSDAQDKKQFADSVLKPFSDVVLKNLSTYGDNYTNAYMNYFRQFQIRIDSVWGLNYILDDLQQPGSALQEILLQIKTNTTPDLSGSAYFLPFAQKLTAFRFIQHIMDGKAGLYPEFQKYQNMMAKMQNEMNLREPYLPKKPRAETDSLKGALSPLARVAWAMHFHEDGSYLTQIKSWLQSEGLRDFWQQPFLAPVQKLEEFGGVEINQYIEGIWTDIWNSQVTPQLDKFPFSVYAGRDKEAIPEDLSKIFNPVRGSFWITFHEYLSPLANYSNGVWVRPYELSDNLKLPKNFLERLNAVQRLSGSLWDAQGNPKPLDIFVKPGLLPTFNNKQLANPPLAALSYLRNGNASVLGFNQQADWRKLPLEWWSSQPAEVGMEFRKDQEDPLRAFAEHCVADSPWNFFRLLQDGELIENLHYRWSLNHPKFPREPLSLEFSFQSDPMAVFTNLAGS